MRQTTLLGFFKPQTVEVINPKIPRSPDSEVPNPVSLPTKKEKVDSLEFVRELGSLSSCSSSSTTSLTDATLVEDELFVPAQCPEAAIVRIRADHLPRIKSITSVLLPVKYPDKFFKECLSDSVAGELSRVLLWKSEPVGWIRCRIESNPDERCKLYIQAIGVLAPYRGLGLATMLLDCVLKPELIERHDLDTVYAHLWESNNDAREWYEKRGFKPASFQSAYYRRLQPAGAWVMTKVLSSPSTLTCKASHDDQGHPT